MSTDPDYDTYQDADRLTTDQQQTTTDEPTETDAAAGTEPQSADRPQNPKDQLASLRTELNELKDKYLRLMAEF